MAAKKSPAPRGKKTGVGRTGAAKSRADSDAARAPSEAERNSSDEDEDTKRDDDAERDDDFEPGDDALEGAIDTSGEGRDDDDLDSAEPLSDESLDDESLSADDDESFGEKPRRGRAETGLVRHGTRDSLARLDPLETYMREIRAHSLLTPEEEKRLAVLYATNADVDAAARLVTANLRLVVKIAYEYRRAYRNMMDLIQEGNMGLMQAVKKYDPYRGVKLSSYAAWWIRAYMLRFILSNWRMVKLGTTQAQRKLFFNLNKERARLSALGIEPTNAAIAERLEVTESEVDEMDKRLSRGDASLDTPMNESDGRQTARVELLPAPGTTPDLVNEGAELSHLIRRNLDEFRETLAGKDLIIFDERIAADEPRTLQDLGDQFGVSRERVRQLEARLTGKLRNFLTERLGDAVEIA